MDTIVALATPPGRGAIAVVRVSGPAALEFLRTHCRPSADWRAHSRRLLLRRLEADGEIVDTVLAAFFPAPGSYTGEDLAEISCHGGLWVCRRILECALSSGARPAEPGEFTRRAFLNGKVDLLQAEAVRELIEAETAFQARLALEQLGGALSRSLEPLRAGLLEVICHLETALEFVEDVASPGDRAWAAERLEALGGELARRVASFARGRLVSEGVKLAIVGKPNVGKSSLFNALLEEERAIVSEIPGTTRDAVFGRFSVAGAPVEVVDTAGMRGGGDRLEALGMRRSREQAADSDEVVLVLDASRPLEAEDWKVWREVGASKPLLVLNKRDLPRRLVLAGEMEYAQWLEVSAKTCWNLEALKEALAGRLGLGGGVREGCLVRTVRQRDAVERCRAEVVRALEDLRGGSGEEYVLHALQRALRELGRLTGEVSAEEVLEGIFSRFCIGK